jgi:autotransporter-associated beta strand protein
MAIAALACLLLPQETRSAVVEYFPNSGLLQLDNSGVNYVPTLGSVEVFIQQMPPSITLNPVSDWTPVSFSSSSDKHIEWAGNIGNASDALAAGVYPLTTLPTNWGNSNFGNALVSRGLTYNQGPNNTQGSVLFGDILGEFGPATSSSTVVIERAVPSENDWTGPAAGDWATGGNWTLAASSSVHRTPISADTASFINPSLAGTITFSGAQTAGNLWFNSASPYTIGTSPGSVLNLGSSAAIWIDAGLHTVAAPLSLAGSLTVDAEPATIAAPNSAGITLSGRITGSGALIKSGPGILVLANSANNNSYGGDTVISAGTLSLAADGNLGSGTTVTLSNATLDFTAPGSSSRTISLTGSGNNTIQIDSSGTVALSGPLSGSGGLVKTGLGTLGISNTTSNFAGGVTVSAGTLQLLASSSLPTSAPISLASGASLDLNGKSQSLVQVIGGGKVRNNNAVTSTLAAAYNAGSANFAAEIQDGAGKIAISAPGGGVLLLSNTGNNYSGGTFIASGGTVSVSADGALGAGTVSVDGGAVQATAAFSSNAGRAFALTGNAGFDVSPGNTLTIAGAVRGNGTLVKTNSGRLMLTAANSYAGGTTVNGGAFAVASDTALGNAGAAVTINNGTLELLSGATIARPIVLNSQNNSVLQSDSGIFTLAGIISGSGALSLQGNGSFLLSNTSNSYSGGTFINGGTLIVNDPTSTVLGPGSNSLFVNPAGQLSGTGTIAPTARLSGGNIAPGGSTAGSALALAGGLSVGGGSLTFRLTNNSDFLGNLVSDKLDLSGGTMGLTFLSPSARGTVSLTGVPLPTTSAPYILITGDYGHAGSSTFLSTLTTQFPLACPLGYSGQWGVQAQQPGSLGTYANYFITLTGPTQWQGSSGSLSDDTHWTNAAPGNPGGIGMFGSMGNGSLSGGTIAASVPSGGYGFHGLIFSNTTDSYDLTPTGTGAIALTGVYNAGGYTGDGQVEVVGGSHRIDASVVLANNTDVTMYDTNARLEIAGMISGSGALALTGSGTLVLSASNNSFAGAVNVNDSAILLITNPGALPDGSAITLGAAALFSLPAPIAMQAPAVGEVSAVPEPGAMMMLLMTGSGFALLLGVRALPATSMRRSQSSPCSERSQ